RRRDHRPRPAAADDHRLPLQLGTAPQLDRRVERVHVQVGDTARPVHRFDRRNRTGRLPYPRPHLLYTAADDQTAAEEASEEICAGGRTSLENPGGPGAMSPAADQRTRSCATELVCRDCGLRLPLADKTFRCLQCGQGLDIDYDYELAATRLAELPVAERPL